MDDGLQTLCKAMQGTVIGFLVVKAIRGDDGTITGSEIMYANDALIGRGYDPKDLIGQRYLDRFPTATDSAAGQIRALAEGIPWSGRISYRDMFTSGYFDVEIVPYGEDHKYAISWSHNVSDEVVAMQTALDAAQLVVETMRTVFETRVGEISTPKSR